MSTYYTIMNMIDGFESVINLAVMVLTIIASWIMYAKAGEPGWAAIVPFYSSYVKFKIAGKKKLFWGYLVACIASIAGCILLTKTSHTQNGISTLKIQQYRQQNSSLIKYC